MAAPTPPPYPPPDAAKTTAAQLCRWALMSIGRLGANQPLDPDDLQVSFEMLNGLVDSFRLNELLVEYQTRSSCQLEANRYTYFIGPGGEFDVSGHLSAFPPMIYYGSLILDYQSGQAIERPLGPPRDIRSVPAGLNVAAFTTDFPDRFFYQPSHVAQWGVTPPGCGTVAVYPMPNNNRHLLSVWFPRMLDTFLEPLAEYYLRPGMVRALRTNLAIEISPLFNAEPSDALRKQAKSAYDWMQVIGGKPNELSFDRALMWRRSPYNLFADDWNTY